MGDTAENVIANVSARVNSLENARNATDLKQSFIDALADCTNDKYNTVCNTGICSRVISALTLMDNDINLAKPMKTKSILRSEIMSKAYRILQDELETHPSARDYLDGCDNEKVVEFEDHIKNKVVTTIMKEYPSCDEKILVPIIKDACAGI